MQPCDHQSLASSDGMAVEPKLALACAPDGTVHGSRERPALPRFAWRRARDADAVQGWERDKAVEAVKQKRPQAHPYMSCWSTVRSSHAAGAACLLLDLHGCSVPCPGQSLAPSGGQINLNDSANQKSALQVRHRLTEGRTDEVLRTATRLYEERSSVRAIVRQFKF